MTIEQAVIGARVKSLARFADIAIGAKGVIDEDYGTGVMVRWDRVGTALRDGFDKTNELHFLALIEDVEFESVSQSLELAGGTNA